MSEIEEAEAQLVKDKERWKHLLDTKAISHDDYKYKINSAEMRIEDMKREQGKHPWFKEL